MVEHAKIFFSHRADEDEEVVESTLPTSADEEEVMETTLPICVSTRTTITKLSLEQTVRHP